MKAVLSLWILLAVASGVHAQQYNIPKDVWLANLKTLMGDGFCARPDSPFRQIFSGAPAECMPEFERLFDRCAKDEPRVVLPERITTVPEATTLAQVMGECVSAHYQGGAALESFYRLQDRTNGKGER